MNKHNATSWPLCSYLLVFLFLGYLLTEGSLLRSLSRENDAKTTYRSGNDESKRKHVSPSLREQSGGKLDPISDPPYCNIGEVTGAEGPVFDGSGDYVLHHLLLNIRHGDRSSIHNIPGAKELSSQVTEKKYLDNEAFKYLPLLNCFVLKSLDESQPNFSAKNGEGDVVLPDALNLSQVFTQCDSDIPPGILTTRGFMQHVLLGKHLSRAYKFYLETVTSPHDLYIRSTNYRRTILSVVALMVCSSEFQTLICVVVITFLYISFISTRKLLGIYQFLNMRDHACSDSQPSRESKDSNLLLSSRVR